MAEHSDRRARRGVVCALVGVVVLCSVPASAQAPYPDFLDRNILTGQGPATTGAAQHRPYSLGWSTQVSAGAGLLSDIIKLPHEPGGVGGDAETGRVYVGTREGQLVCLDGGRVLWSIDIGGQLLAPPKVYKNVVIAATGEGVVYIVNKITGERKARSILGEELITIPVVADDGAGHTRIYVGSSAESVFSVNLEDGAKVWRAHRDAPSGFSIFGFAQPVAAAGSVFAAFADGVVEALDPANGATRWDKHLSPAGDMIDVDGLTYNGVSLFAASYSGGVFAIDPASGLVLWQHKLPQANRIVTDGLRVYAGGPGYWAGLRAYDGKELWRYAFGDGRSQTVASVTDKLLIFAEQDGPILFVDKKTGAGVGALSVGDGFSSPPSMLGPVLFALSNYGRVWSAIVAP
jgi:outer membrane protein assembly factor BamB